ncbi:hypothetical protein EWM64_g7662 [Hericium alpestre]|uniref:Uncharacterized protein n=1 Tax=Hericium alpestre TaxID=135208 RepID=A0A4Y9ZRA3_9AGAM|nr:hypothetical protein EWM64_g7662 [Hericium alpestre]
MTDTGRQNFGDKVSAAVKPDSEKSNTEHAGDKIKGKTDSAASSAEPQSQKSWTQSASDTVSGNQNKNSESMTDKAKDAVGMGKK